MNYNRFNITFLLLLLLSEVGYSEIQKPDSEVLEFISYFKIEAQEVARIGKEPYATDILDYLKLLESDWSEVLKKTPDSYSPPISFIHQSFQFYYAGRKKIEPPSIQSVLNPPMPLRLPAFGGLKNSTAFIGASKHWKDSEFQIKITWFDLFNHLDISKILNEDKDLKSISILSMYMNSFNDSELLSRLSRESFLKIVQSLSKVLNIDSKLKGKLISYQEKPDGSSFSIGQKNAMLLEGLPRQVEQFYNLIWFQRPELITDDIESILIEINVKLKSISVMLNNLPDSKIKMDIISETIMLFDSLLSITNVVEFPVNSNGNVDSDFTVSTKLLDRFIFNGNFAKSNEIFRYSSLKFEEIKAEDVIINLTELTEIYYNIIQLISKNLKVEKSNQIKQGFKNISETIIKSHEELFDSIKN